MRMSTVAAFMILTTILLSGCAQDHVAALEDRSQNYYSRNGVLSASNAYANNASITFQNAAVMPVATSDLAAPVTRTASAASFQWPVNGMVTEKFGAKGAGISNQGITIAAAEGTPIRAAQSGTIAFIGNDVKTFGHMVIVRHANGDMSSYAHARSISVHKGQQVAAGDTLGFVGKSGDAKTPQLHFALREGDRSVDPMTRLPQQLALR